MIGFKRGGKADGTELTEQEMLEIEMEERRRFERKRRKLMGDETLAVRK